MHSQLNKIRLRFPDHLVVGDVGHRYSGPSVLWAGSPSVFWAVGSMGQSSIGTVGHWYCGPLYGVTRFIVLVHSIHVHVYPGLHRETTVGPSLCLFALLRILLRWIFFQAHPVYKNQDCILFFGSAPVHVDQVVISTSPFPFVMHSNKIVHQLNQWTFLWHLAFLSCHLFPSQTAPFTAVQGSECFSLCPQSSNYFIICNRFCTQSPIGLFLRVEIRWWRKTFSG